MREKIRRYKAKNLGEVTVPHFFSHAKGCYIFTSRGDAVLDFTSGYGVTNTGWMHPKVVQAIKQQLKKATYCPPWLATELALELSEVILEIVPKGMTACLRSTGGSEAIEGTLRAVSALTGKNTLVSFNRSYHGGTAKAIRISDYETFNLAELPINPRKYLKVPFPGKYDSCANGGLAITEFDSLNMLEKIFKSESDIAAFIAEPIIGSGGVLIPPEGFLLKIEDMCRRYGILFIIDEVITGFGRIGRFTASEIMKLTPDAIVFAKGMGGGYIPIGCAVLNEDLTNVLKKYQDVSPTFGWTPLACAAALANIGIIKEEGLCEKSETDGNKLLSATRSLMETYLPNHTHEVRGKGMMVGIQLVDKQSQEPCKLLVNKLLLAMFNMGLMCSADWNSQTIIIMPPLTITSKELNKGLGIMENVLKRYKKNS
jgi:4-aminobutyrate aminotransferase-like enzyme